MMDKYFKVSFFFFLMSYNFFKCDDAYGFFFFFLNIYQTYFYNDG